MNRIATRYQLRWAWVFYLAAIAAVSWWLWQVADQAIHSPWVNPF